MPSCEEGMLALGSRLAEPRACCSCALGALTAPSSACRGLPELLTPPLERTAAAAAAAAAAAGVAAAWAAAACARLPRTALRTVPMNAAALALAAGLPGSSSP
jgi:hypothetical protein